ncbi:MAG: hypothetical protein SV422_05065 [Pseudomonadota bacterium]|nr:hypothetical protein [Pseudomonadota bacterium]
MKLFPLRSLALCASLLCTGLFCAAVSAQDDPGASYDPNAPTPRFPDGTPILGPDADGLGFWDRGTGPMVGGANYPAADEIPFKPWARALYDYRQETLAKDDPHVRCAPPGAARQFAVPFGLQIVQAPHMNRIYILSGGSTRPWREIFMDADSHPEYLNPTYFGHSIGKWEGDTLVIDTVGFNERFWLHRDGFPHTESLHLIERLSRPRHGLLRYEITIDDPAAYSEPWTTAWEKQWTPGEELIEYFCQDNNIDQYHMMGNESVAQ